MVLVFLIFNFFINKIPREGNWARKKIHTLGNLALIWYQFYIFFFHRLAVIMGLTWITGLAAGFVDLEPVWYVFVGLNTLQGLFIFVAFTCNKKVLFFFIYLYSCINFLSWMNHECRKYFVWWRNHGYWGISTLKHFIPWTCIENPDGVLFRNFILLQLFDISSKMA